MMCLCFADYVLGRCELIDTDAERRRWMKITWMLTFSDERRLNNAWNRKCKLYKLAMRQVT